VRIRTTDARGTLECRLVGGWDVHRRCRLGSLSKANISSIHEEPVNLHNIYVTTMSVNCFEGVENWTLNMYVMLSRLEKL
jgi:hypothetical protein